MTGFVHKVKCLVCNQMVGLRRDWTFKKHTYLGEPCEGSGQENEKR